MSLLTFLLACPSAVTVGDVDVDDFATDTAADDSAADTDTATDTADTAGDTAEDEPETDFSSYTGTRNFYANLYDWYVCDESITESGTQLTSGDEYDALVAACPSCGYFYENVPDVEAVCDGYLALGTTYRAILLTDAGGIAYFYSLGDDGSASEIGSDNSYVWDGASVGTYDYEFEFYSVPVAASGTMTFALTE